MNALHLAACGGHLEIVKYLMPKFGDSKFDLNNLAQNCLHNAVNEGHLKVVRYLIEEGGFDPSLRDKVKDILHMHAVCLHDVSMLPYTAWFGLLTSGLR